MLGANVLVMFLIDFLEQARVTSKQIAVKRNSDLFLLREGCTLRGLERVFNFIIQVPTHMQAETGTVKGWLHRMK